MSVLIAKSSETLVFLQSCSKFIIYAFMFILTNVFQYLLYR